MSHINQVQTTPQNTRLQSSQIDYLQLQSSSQERARNIEFNGETSQSLSKNDLKNISLNLEMSIKKQEETFNELDNKISFYARKILNGVQELWKSAASKESLIKDILNMGNQTRNFLKKEFRKLQEQTEPLPNIEPSLTNIKRNLDDKLQQLTVTVDDSFSALLISQNSFIKSCHRVQEEETQLYDLLNDMLLEMRNRSVSGLNQINESLANHTDRMTESLNHIFSILTQVEGKIFENTEETEASYCFLSNIHVRNICRKNKFDGYEQVISSLDEKLDFNRTIDYEQNDQDNEYSEYDQI